MPKGPRGEKRPDDVIGAAIVVAKIETGEVDATPRRPTRGSALITAPGSMSCQSRLPGGSDDPTRATAFGESEFRQRAGVSDVDPVDILAVTLSFQVFKWPVGGQTGALYRPSEIGLGRGIF